MPKFKSIKNHVPNTITSLNLFSGCAACTIAVEGYLTTASFLILLAALFDFFDGLAARILNAYSPMGKEMDSLADMVSFGLAPGLIAFAYLKISIFGSVSADLSPKGLSFSQLAILLSAFIIPVFSAFRLAKFNTDPRQGSSFIGVPTPANAIFWASLPLVFSRGEYPLIEKWMLSPFLLVMAILVTSLLLVAEIPMFSIKVKNLAWKGNQVRYMFLATLIFLAVIFRWLAIPLALFVYILFSLVEAWVGRKNNHPA